MVTDLTLYAYEQGKHLLGKRQAQTLKEYGQFLTPPSVARYMANQLGEIQNGAHLLEPAIGSGVLVCAVIERLIAENRSLELWIDAYDIDAELCEVARKNLALAAEKADSNGIKVHWQVFQGDFVLACLPETQPTLFATTEKRRRQFDFVISNPPYFKLNISDKRVKAASGLLNGHTNIYTLFMALGASLLRAQGQACFIVPRSFCSGVYFSNFRRNLLREVTPLSIHLFQSREHVFKSDDVLQENIIFSFEKSPKAERYWAGFVNISTSKDDSSLQNNGQISRQVAFRYFLSRNQEHFFFRLPTGALDEKILDVVDRWDGLLESYGLQVSTGRVVPFRSRKHLKEVIIENNSDVPLLWMQNVKPYKIEYPLSSFEKPQAITTDDHSLLVPISNYVLLRRFSAKEDRRRLIAAPFLMEHFPHPQVGFENHLNFIYRKKGVMDKDEALGLSAILNSAIVDRYFRIINGNTQVNAAELRALPLPPLEVIRQIGRRMQGIDAPTSDIVDNLVFSTLWDTKLLEEDFPIIQETRITMGKIEQAQEILEALGLPSAQQNEMAALTLLVLAKLSEETAWKEAATENLRVHDILQEIKQRYGREYAENTRETIRRQVLHQFEQAGVVVRNPDDPSLATNSPRTHYILSEIVLDALRSYNTTRWESKRQAFISQRGMLLDIYQKGTPHGSTACSRWERV